MDQYINFVQHRSWKTRIKFLIYYLKEYSAADSMPWVDEHTCNKKNREWRKQNNKKGSGDRVDLEHVASW